MTTLEQELLTKYPDYQLWKLTKIESINPSLKYPDDFWVIGTLIDPPVVGCQLLIARLANSIHNCENYGVFNSSAIQSISEDGASFTTRNSKYKLEKLNSVMDVIANQCEKAGFNPHNN